MKRIQSKAEVTRVLKEYGVEASPAMADAIGVYAANLLRWNSKISLTTVVDPVEILKFHFGESFFAASKVPITHGRLADVGSGAGFPGLALAMLLPSLSVVLIEPNLKKTVFLSDVIRELNIENAEVWRKRTEEVDVSGEFDFVTARALGGYDHLLRWSRAALRPGGKVVLWLGSQDAASISFESGWNWAERIPIPGSDNRKLLAGTPNLRRE